MSIDTKGRILAAGGELMRRQGYAATGMKQILKAAGAVPASAYHHFPGGKQEIAEAAIRQNGAAYMALIDASFAGRPDVAAAVRDFLEGAATLLEVTEFADACPIATLALEVASGDPRLRQATGDVFEAWLTRCSGHLTDSGLEPDAARACAITVFAALEGGFMLCRASRDAEPLRILARTLSRIVA